MVTSYVGSIVRDCHVGSCELQGLLTIGPGKKLTRRKHPDHLVDTCKCLSINRMAAGSRLQVQGCRFKTAGSRLQVQGCRFKAAGSRLQVQGCRFEAAKVQSKISKQYLCCKALINKPMSISNWFHMGYFEIISHSLNFLWIHIHEINKEKTSSSPGRLL